MINLYYYTYLIKGVKRFFEDFHNFGICVVKAGVAMDGGWLPSVVFCVAKHQKQKRHGWRFCDQRPNFLIAGN
jgi:hypothetical protein